LVQVHGGGQSASLDAVVVGANRGYAVISINWAGNPITIPDGYSGPNTDWGAVDPTQNTHNDHYSSIAPDSKTLDPVPSARNSNWFLLYIAARRAVTFLQQQPEVDSSNIGIYGHSMGGNITLCTAAVDKRIKAASPSSGGGVDDMSDNAKGTFFDNAHYAALVNCPILFLSPSNDFHGTIDGIDKTADHLRSTDVRFSRPPHLNHRGLGEFDVTQELWMDEWLKRSYHMPQSPITAPMLVNSDGVPELKVVPDRFIPYREVGVYYTQDYTNDTAYSFEHTCDRFWHYAAANRTGDVSLADLPILRTDKPIWAFANVRYSLANPVLRAGYYWRPPSAEGCWLSSRLVKISVAQLTAVKAIATLKPTTIIESFKPGWQKEWYSFSPDSFDWPWRTLKFCTAQYAAPPGARLQLDVETERPNKLVVQLGDYAAEVSLHSGLQTVQLKPADFTDVKSGAVLSDWLHPGEFSLGPSADSIRNGIEVQLGGAWSGPLPVFENLCWATPH
jgi:pimeloyl-ACP methyl ester carboxylesterase